MRLDDSVTTRSPTKSRANTGWTVSFPICFNTVDARHRVSGDSGKTVGMAAIQNEVEYDDFSKMARMAESSFPNIRLKSKLAFC